MQQKKIEGYRPNYPKKLIRGAALTAAAMLTLSPALACRTAPQISGDIVIDPAELVCVLRVRNRTSSGSIAS